MLLNTFAVIAAVFGVIAAFRSHTLKRPVPTPNLYSPHSYLGILTLVFLGLQVRGPAVLHALLQAPCQLDVLASRHSLDAMPPALITASSAHRLSMSRARDAAAL